MKKIFLILSLFYYSFSYSQSVDLDREYFSASFVELPSNPILEDNKRTYSTNTDKISIAGFSKVNTAATIAIDFSYDGILVQDFNIDRDKHEKKDKKGNVISTSYTYKVKAYFKSSGRINVENASTGNNYSDTYRHSSNYTSHSFKSYSKAQRYYDNNKLSLKNKYRKKHKRSMIKSAKNYVNATYGYPIYNAKDNFWILDSKKHPEYNAHKRYYNIAKNTLAKMRHNESTVDIAYKLEPVITYFKEVVNKYTGRKRRMRKMRYASYYNLAKIYYYLDKPEDVKKYGQKIIDNKYDKKDGKRLIKKANTLQNRLNTNHLDSRHFNTLTEDLTNQSTEEVEETLTKKTLAYLITATNDTLQATISNLNISKIKYSVDLNIPDNYGNTQAKTFSAENCIALALANEDKYKVIAFKEAQKETNSTEKKFVKVLFESDQIQLYLFDNKEIVLKRPNEEKGKSTLSSSFAFGLNKKLSSYFAGDCPVLQEKTKNKDFKNTVDSLILFCEILSKCE